MLILSRKVGESIVIGPNVTLVVQRISGGRVSIAIEAPRSVVVLRGELAPFGVAPAEGEGLAAPQSADVSVPFRHGGDLSGGVAAGPAASELIMTVQQGSH